MSIQIKDTGKYGTSLYAERPFKKDEVIFGVGGVVVHEPTIYTIPIDSGLFIDDQSYGKHLCHSCEPNCGIKSRTLVVAMQDIPEGQEITIDYAMIVPEYGQEITEEQLVCHCGSTKCRGRLGAYKKFSYDPKPK